MEWIINLKSKQNKKQRPARFDYKSEIVLDLKQNQTKNTQYFELVGINYV